MNECNNNCHSNESIFLVRNKPEDWYITKLQHTSDVFSEKLSLRQGHCPCCSEYSEWGCYVTHTNWETHKSGERYHHWLSSVFSSPQMCQSGLCKNCTEAVSIRWSQSLPEVSALRFHLWLHQRPVGPVNTWWSEIIQDAGSVVGTKMSENTFEYDLRSLTGTLQTFWNVTWICCRQEPCFKIHTSTIPQGDHNSHTTACTCTFMYRKIFIPYGKIWLGERCWHGCGSLACWSNVFPGSVA